MISTGRLIDVDTIQHVVKKLSQKKISYHLLKLFIKFKMVVIMMADKKYYIDVADISALVDNNSTILIIWVSLFFQVILYQ